jgi:hypothetical protein
MKYLLNTIATIAFLASYTGVVLGSMLLCGVAAAIGTLALLVKWTIEYVRSEMAWWTRGVER